MRKRLAFIVIMLLTGVGLAACTAYAQPAPKPPPKPASALAVQVQTVSVTLTDTAITTKQTSVRPEVGTIFLVTNHGTVAHQFWLMPANMAQVMKQMPMAQWQSHLLYSTADIAPGKMAEFEYTFSTATVHHAWAMGNYTPSTHTLIAVPLHITG